MAHTLSGERFASLLGDWKGTGPIYVSLSETIKRLLADGHLAPGLRLPAERDAAKALNASRTTVSAAYRQLRDWGYLSSRLGAGSWTTIPGGQRIRTPGLWADDAEPGSDDLIDLGCASMPAPAQLIPAAQSAAVELQKYSHGRGYAPRGITDLRAEIATRFTARGLPTRTEQILVTNGAQAALDLVLRFLTKPGQVGLIEAPTYPNALLAMQAHRLRITSCGMHPQGWDIPIALGTIRDAAPRVFYSVPDFHNPTGHVMPLELRERLPAVAHAARCDVIVDETFSDLGFDDDALPPVAAFDRHSRVITIGGMSKTFWSGLRIGWIRAASPLIARLAAIRVETDIGSPILEQLVALHLFAVAQDVVAERRDVLRQQRDAMVAALAATLPAWRFAIPNGGVSLWVELDAPVGTALEHQALRHGVQIAAGRRFGADGIFERFVRLLFTKPGPVLADAVGRLRTARTELLPVGSSA